MKAIILAAGRGMRLNQGRSSIPKSMELIGNQSIIHYQIEQCLNLGIKKFVVVVGFEKVTLTQHVLKMVNSSQVHFVENPLYENTNTLYSLYLAGKYFSEDFIYFNADVLFHPELLKKIVNDNQQTELLIEKKKCGEEEVKVAIEDDRIIEINKQVSLDKAAGEFIGIGKFAKHDLPAFFEALELGALTGQHNNYFEYAVNMISSFCFLHPVYTDGLPCIEIDFQEDLKKARDVIYPQIQSYLNNK
ncbi:MAG TPA: phosphocholine cytidylyltransferase family protein [Candidatus Cloacimonadota bacterium]|nr:phosphocholine cytidylyltransferase family protein [Candidatus Cloacimonadota bacterium]HOD53949.1 phosphocholine cytidylyltransferase family protein [Candidatus Cloacimonadota bacterium]HPM00534.1 phosphocholine cytidylyltransferase family protein [Candidatus Cloacimonadota bacterium]